MQRYSLVLLTLAACGDVGIHKLPDGPPNGDMGSNSALLIHVTTLGASGYRAPSAGIEVVFSEPGGTTKHAPTDLDGKLAFDAPAHTDVTAVWPSGANNYTIETIMDASPGDDLVFSGYGNDDSPIGVYNVTWPAQVGVTSYYVSIGNCPSVYVPTAGATSLAYPLPAYCLPTTEKVTISVVGYASAATYYLEQPNVSYTLGGTTSLGAGWTTPTQTFQAQLTNTDPTIDSYASVYRYASTGYNSGLGGPVTTTSTPLSFATPPSANAVVQTQLSRNGGSCCGQQDIYQRINGSSLTYNLDIGANRLPWIDLTAYDQTTRTVTTTLVGTGTIDAARVELYTRHTIPVATDASAPVSNNANWIIIAPTLATPIVLPMIPPEVADVNTVAAVGQTPDYGYINGAELMESADVPNYAAVRSGFGSYVNNPIAAVGAGILRISRWYND